MKWICPVPICGQKMTVIASGNENGKYFLHILCSSPKCRLNLKQRGKNKSQAVFKMKTNMNRINRELAEHLERKAAAEKESEG
jgi:hypothetical protein